MGISPTGKPVEGTGTTTARLSGEKIEEGWVNWDALGLMQQLGAILQSEQAGGAAAG